MLVGLQRAALAGRRPEEGAILGVTQAIEQEAPGMRRLRQANLPLEHAGNGRKSP
jgi:hypothetical protein